MSALNNAFTELILEIAFLRNLTINKKIENNK